MGVQLSGLSSGLDWRSIVDQLVALERVPQQRLEDDKRVNETKISTLGGVRNRLEDLQQSLDTLASDNLFSGRSALVEDLGEDPDVLGAFSEDGTLTGSYKFEITQLATETERLGATGISGNLAATNDVSGLTVGTMSTAVTVTSGSFTINGAEVEVDTADSLQDVFDAINTATSGDVTASYDSGTDRITLTSGSSSEIVLGSPTDDSNFLTAVGLFSNGADSVSSYSTLGALNLTNSLSSANLSTPVSGNGTLTVNGVDISYTTDDTLKEVIQRINDSEADVSLSYDASADAFNMRNDLTGSFGLSVVDTSGNLGEALGLVTGASVTLGVNANFRLNDGTTLISNSNNITEEAHGIEGLTVTAKELGTQSVDVNSNTSNAEARINTFISEFNDLMDFLERNTEITVNDDGEIDTGLLADNREMSGVISELRRALQVTVGDDENEVKRLQDIGIDWVAGENRIEIDDELAFDDAFEQFSAQIGSVFTDENDGIITRLESIIDTYVEDDAILDTQIDTLNRKNDDIDDQVDQLERFILSREQQLVDSFLQLEQAQQQINTQQQALARLTG